MPIVPGPPTDDEKAPLGFQDDAWYSLEACQRSSDSGECSSLSDVRVSVRYFLSYYWHQT